MNKVARQIFIFLLLICFSRSNALNVETSDGLNINLSASQIKWLVFDDDDEISESFSSINGNVAEPLADLLKASGSRRESDSMRIRNFVKKSDLRALLRILYITDKFVKPQVKSELLDAMVDRVTNNQFYEVLAEYGSELVNQILNFNERSREYSEYAIPFLVVKSVEKDMRSHINSVAWSPRELCLAIGLEDSHVCLCNMVDMNRISYENMAGHRDSVATVSWSCDGQQLASGACDGSMRVWSPARKSLFFSVPVCKYQHYRVSSVSWSPDSKFIGFAADEDGASVLHNDGRRSCEIEKGWANAISWGPGESGVAVGSQSGHARIWKIGKRRSECVRELRCGRGVKDVYDIKWSPSGNYIAAGFANGTVRIWTPRSSDATSVFDGHRGRVETITWSPSEEFLASGSTGKEVKIWSVESEKCVKTLKFDDAVYSVSWSADGKYLAVGSGSNLFVYSLQLKDLSLLQRLFVSQAKRVHADTAEQLERYYEELPSGAKKLVDEKVGDQFKGSGSLLKAVERGLAALWDDDEADEEVDEDDRESKEADDYSEVVRAAFKKGSKDPWSVEDDESELDLSDKIKGAYKKAVEKGDATESKCADDEDDEYEEYEED